MLLSRNVARYYSLSSVNVRQLTKTSTTTGNLPRLCLSASLTTSARRSIAEPPKPQVQVPPSTAPSPSSPPHLTQADIPAAAPPPPPKRSFLSRWPVIRYTVWGCGSIIFTIVGITGAILVHDALTYGEAHIKDVPMTPLALHPDLGGPKNLPIVVDDIGAAQDGDNVEIHKKERLVIVGGGWAAIALLSKLDAKKYNVTVVAPENYYLFTPLLPSATVGTVEPRSLVEPIRKIIARHHGQFIQGAGVDCVMGSAMPPSKGGEERLLEVRVISGHDSIMREEGEGAKVDCSAADAKHIYVPYDRLIVAVGSITSTHGVSGLENCFHLKTLQDARRIRNHIMDNLEIASLPTTSPEERKRLLSMVICGGGPTGVETASEIYDMLNEDVLDYFPKVLRANASVSLIQSREHILNTYAEKISEYAEKKFAKDELNIIVNARVKRVEPDKVVYTIKKADGGVEEREVASGFTLWSTGIAMSPFTRRLTSILPNQSHLKALQVDSHLRVKGAPLGSMYALGDASTIDTGLIDYLYDFVDDCDQDHDGALNYAEFQLFAQRIGKKFPLASKHFTKLKEMFEKYDLDHDGKLHLNEVADMLLQTQSKMTSLPATAQVASQQGAYLAKKLNKLAKRRDSGEDMHPHEDGLMLDVDDVVYKPFQYTNFGALAYVGNSAVFDLPLPEPLGSLAGGLIAMYAWRSFYLSEQVSTRTRALLLGDYIKRGIWGRDLSRI